MNLFYEIHKDIPREGPGNNEATRKAYQLIEGYLTKPFILDVGCGPGMQTIELGSMTDGSILATDVNEGFLSVLQDKIESENLTNKIKVKIADMKSLPYPDQTFDVIWSEGAIFIMGFEEGLREWKRLLKHDGFLVVSELSWISADAPQEVKEFWSKAYPRMDSLEGNRMKAEKQGYKTIETFILPEAGWWEHYYLPLEARIKTFREKYQGNQEALKILGDFQAEIKLYRNFSKYYGYVFYVLQK